MAIKFLLNWQPKFQNPHIPSLWFSSLVGIVIGFKSGLFGIGGGALSLPFLLFCGLHMREASGTSSAFTFPIAVVGTLGNMFLPLSVQIPWSTGAVYWPAVALAAPFTMLGAPIGTWLSHRLSGKWSKRILALLLMIISIRMLRSAFQTIF
ncbi:MAG: sulfite exporter TauE/SafE family protein [Myxococcota bacterium]